MSRKIKNSDLIINEDGSIFHLHLLPEDIAENILLVGDPQRVNMIAEFFNEIEVKKKNREFFTVTGYYKGIRITALSTGIGTDNIDIVLNELDALVNIDLKEFQIKREKKSLNIIRIGTSGAVQPNIPINSYLLSEKSIGFDGLLNFYSGRENVSDMNFGKKFMEHIKWDKSSNLPYVVDASKKLNKILSDNNQIIKGVTIAANGFYGPQGRILRLPIVNETVNEKIISFSYQNKYKITNYEMESSALFGLSKLLGHHAACICLIIANRTLDTTSKNYKLYMNKMIEFVLNSLVENTDDNK